MVLASTVLGVALVKALRRASLAAHVASFVLLPTAVTAYVVGSGIEVSAFLMLKLWSVAVGSLLVSTVRFRGWAQRPLAHRLVVVVLAVNILEASVTEAFGGGWLNAAVGALLLLGQPFANSITLGGERRDLRYPASALGAAAYRVWNFTFISGTAPPGHPLCGCSSLTLVHLGVPLLLMRGNPALFLQFRAYVLAFVVYAVVAFPDAMQAALRANAPMTAVGRVRQHLVRRPRPNTSAAGTRRGCGASVRSGALGVCSLVLAAPYCSARVGPGASP